MSKQTVPARKGVGYTLNLGQKITIINTHGTQVVDFWAVSSTTRRSTCRWSIRGRPSSPPGPKPAILLYDNLATDPPLR